MFDRFRHACEVAGEVPLANLVVGLAARIGRGPHRDFNQFRRELEEEAERRHVKVTPKRIKLVQSVLAQRDEQAEPVIAKRHKPGKIVPDSLHGLFEAIIEGSEGR